MSPSAVRLQKSHEQVTTHDDLSCRVRRNLTERLDSCRAIETLCRATDGEIFLFGGAIRRGLFGDKLSGDIDIMVPNGDDRATDALDSLKVPFVLNSQRHRRYHWNLLQIDVLQPREFYSGFENVESALCYFDLRINALSLHLRSGRILDPFQIVSQTPLTDPGINWPRWFEMSPLDVVVLAIRLVKIMHEVPALTISAHDARRMSNEVVPRILECNWDDVQQRFPEGKCAFLQAFTAKVLGRTQSIRPDRYSGVI